jgi:uncharacterized protein
MPALNRPVVVAGSITAQAAGFLLVAAAATSPRRGRGGRGLRAELGFRLRAIDLGIGTAIAVAALFVNATINIVLSALGVVEPGEVDNVTAVFGGAVDALGFLLIGLAIAIAAPIGEEVLFRGLLLQALHRRWGVVPAVVVSAVLFGLVHAQPGRGGVVLVIGTGLFGLVLAVLVLRSGRLGPALVGHAVYNGLVVLLLAVALTADPGAV